MSHINGLYLIKNFINESLENDLVANIYNNKWDETIKRRVQHYGYTFNYNTKKIDNKSKEFPEWIINLVELMNKLDLCKKFHPDQCTINEYPPGIGISRHIDTHSCFTDTIVSISLMSPTVMYFIDETSLIKEKIPIYLPERSILIISGEARYKYSHSIPYRKTDIDVINKVVYRNKRLSITLRKTKKGGCRCKWESLCDSKI